MMRAPGLLLRSLLRWRAVACLSLGAHDRARAGFEALLQRWPDDAHALASSAHLAMQSGRLQDALGYSQRLLQCQPQDAAAWFNHGYLLEAAERWEDALAAFRNATERSPALDRAWYGQGMVLVRLGRLEEAAAALQRNTELQPMSPYGWYQLAHVQAERRLPGEAARIISHLRGFEPGVAAQLEREMRTTGAGCP